MLVAAVSSEENLAQIDRYKQITAKLADPRKSTDAETAALVREAKPFYWLSGSIHSPETGSPEMLMELAYRLAVEESPHIQAIRKNLIVLITPVVEVDGRDRMLDIYRYRKANPGKQAPGLVYWGKYVAHDNNRDAMGMALALSKVMMKTFLDWHPQVFHDLHESVPYLYTSTGTGPYNSWLDPIVVIRVAEARVPRDRGNDPARRAGRLDARVLRRLGPELHVLHCQRSQRDRPLLRDVRQWRGRHARAEAARVVDVAHLVPPQPAAAQSQMVDCATTSTCSRARLLLALKYVADNREEFLSNFALKSKRSIAKAKTEGPAAWIIPNDGKRPALAAQLARPAATRRGPRSTGSIVRPRSRLRSLRRPPAVDRPQPSGDPAPRTQGRSDQTAGSKSRRGQLRGADGSAL